MDKQVGAREAQDVFAATALIFGCSIMSGNLPAVKQALRDFPDRQLGSGYLLTAIARLETRQDLFDGMLEITLKSAVKTLMRYYHPE